MKMRKTLITALVLGACVGTQAFAQSTKEDTITFALSVQGQSSVSTSTAINAGYWSDIPTHYKTATKKLTQADIIKAIGYIMHGSGGYYSTKASLMLVQGELSGFFNIDDDLANDNDPIDSPYYGSQADHDYYSTPDGDILDGWFDTSAADSTSISWGMDTYVRLATGRHFKAVPDLDYFGDALNSDQTIGNYPPGHMQPWGQIYVKDPANSHVSGTTTANPVCENVTFFFNLTVQECYDCYYLNSFISDSTFTFKAGSQSGNPCCTSPTDLTGKGVDKYYLTLSFDNTENNHYLNDTWNDRYSDYNWFYTGNEGWYPDDAYFHGNYAGVTPDGLSPDSVGYIDIIRSGIGIPFAYEMRFTLNGIFTYTWTLKFINSGDASMDFVGVGKYDANGYGFIALDCSLITGTATFTEKVVKDIGCCDDIPWYSNESGNDGWYGPGDRYAYSDGYYDGESPFNPPTALTFHNDEDWFIWDWARPHSGTD